MQVSTEHPPVWQDLTIPTLVRSPALSLQDDLSKLMLQARPMQGKSKDRDNFNSLRTAFTQHPSLHLGEDTAGIMVPNVPLKNKWISDYKLAAAGSSLGAHKFTALVHFGSGHYTSEHFETCAAATYGVLLIGRKLWTFAGLHGERFEVTQEEGDTVYVPPGWIHSVHTLSNGALLVGETSIAQSSPAAFLKRAAYMVAGRPEDRMDPSAEAELLLQHFGVKMSVRLQSKKGAWNTAPAMTALRQYVAKQQGGTKRRDASGRRRKRKV